jgi:hypothetical protein
MVAMNIHQKDNGYLIGRNKQFSRYVDFNSSPAFEILLRKKICLNIFIYDIFKRRVTQLKHINKCYYIIINGVVVAQSL